MPQLYIGDPVPWFRAQTVSTPQFNFSMAAGRYICLAFVPSSTSVRAQEILAAAQQHRRLFDDAHACLFMVTGDRSDLERPELADQGGLRWFVDPLGDIAGLYGVSLSMAEQQGPWILLDPMMRVLGLGPAADFAAMTARLADLPDPALHAGSPSPTPVLLAPRIFEPEFCRKLIGLHQADGGFESGFMREVDGRTVQVKDASHKQRTDYVIADEAMREACRARILRRLVPEIRKVFQFTVTRMERYLVGCYDSTSGGHFRPHRDNTTSGTAHRRFAVSINLNADEYDGGELRFPEFGRQTFRPPTGGAVVFSCSLLHEATPVTRGRRYAFLPFLYDEEAARIREANNSRLSEDIGQYRSGLQAPATAAE